MVRRFGAGRRDVSLDFIDIAPRWRAIHDARFWWRAAGGAAQLLRDVARLGMRLATARPEVVHLTTSGRLALARDVAMIGLARLFRAPVVYHIRFGRVPDLEKNGGVEWRALRVALRLATAVVPLDENTEAVVRRNSRARIERIPNCYEPIQPSRLEEAAESERTVVYLGWVIPTKGMGELARAWGAVRRPGWRLVIAGPGDDAYVEGLRRTAGDGVDFTGELPHEEALRVVGNADILVLPSHTEGFPNVIVEAMALGRAVLATTVGAIPEMLSDGCGVLVPPRDPAALAAALRALMDDDMRREELGRKAEHRAVSTYAIGPVFERYASLWRHVARPRA